MNNYSYETSLPAMQSNEAFNKRTQMDAVLNFVKHGSNNLLQISILMGIPQSTVAARVNDLIEEGKVDYLGKVVYNGFTRKKIVLIKQEVKINQPELF